MIRIRGSSQVLSAAAAALLVWSTGSDVATATEPCGDFGECKVLVEINASDGDIGFHFLFDGDDLVSAKMKDPEGAVIYRNKAKGRLSEQKLTENFVESAEPVCREELAEDPEEEVVTLEEFLERWPAGTYKFIGKGEDDERSRGETELTHALPAAPAKVNFIRKRDDDDDDDDKNGAGVISWKAGDDLGECASREELYDLVEDEILEVHPEDVKVDAWEVVLEPDVEDGDPTGSLVYTVRVAGDIEPKQVTVPADYLASLPDDTPVKVEVGAIGGEDNATFTEVGGFCVNEVKGCEDE